MSKERERFIDKYIRDSFFWIRNEEESEFIQGVLIEFGLNNPTGESDTIKYSEKLTNICTFNPDKYHNTMYFQRVDMWLPNTRYGEPVNFDQFCYDYFMIE